MLFERLNQTIFSAATIFGWFSLFSILFLNQQGFASWFVLLFLLNSFV